MAAVDLTAQTSFPYNRVKTSVGTTYQLFNLPRGTRTVIVKTVGASYVGFGVADGGTPDAGDGGSAYYLGALTAERFDLDPAGNGRGAIGIGVAAQAGTTTVYLCLEGE